MRSTYFKDVEISTKFTVGDVPYVKKSTRTAWAGKGHPAEGRWFYFGALELVTVQHD